MKIVASRAEVKAAMVGCLLIMGLRASMPPTFASDVLQAFYGPRPKPSPADEIRALHPNINPSEWPA